MNKVCPFCRFFLEKNEEDRPSLGSFESIREFSYYGFSQFGL